MDCYNHRSNQTATRVCTLFCAVPCLQSGYRCFLSVGCSSHRMVSHVANDVGGRQWPMDIPCLCHSALPVAERKVPTGPGPGYSSSLNVSWPWSESWAGSHIRPVTTLVVCAHCSDMSMTYYKLWNYQFCAISSRIDKICVFLKAPQKKLRP